MDQQLKVGIIGCGGIANNKHMPSIKKAGYAQMIAFCDIDIEKAKKAVIDFGTEGAMAYEDYRELLQLDLDAVYVCTPNRSHAMISIDALFAGKHVMCEKPMAINYKEANHMVQSAKETGKLLTIGYQNRYRPDSRYLKRECAEEALGEIYYAKAKALRRRAVPTWGVFLNEFEQGGGPLIDIGTHALDLTLWMMDNYEPNYVVGTTYHKLNKDTDQGNEFGPWKPEEFTVEDSAFGFIVMKNGATITLEASWALNTLDVLEASTVLCGTKGGADMQDGLRLNGIKHDCPYVVKPNLRSGGVAFFEGVSDDPAVLEQQVFARAILGEGPLTVLPEQAAMVTKLLEAIYESAKIGKPVYL